MAKEQLKKRDVDKIFSLKTIEMLVELIRERDSDKDNKPVLKQLDKLVKNINKNKEIKLSVLVTKDNEGLVLAIKSVNYKKEKSILKEKSEAK